MGIEMGFKFRPSDEEMMRCLLNRVTGSRSLGWCCGGDLIGTADVYGSKEPWEVFGGDRKEEKERFFFTELRRVGKNKTTNQRICRNVGKGFWSNKGQKKWIFGQRGIIGYKRGFRYERKKGQMMNSDWNSDCDWLLKEYIVTVKRGVKEKYANCALCVLKRKEKKGGSYSPTEDEISAAANIEVTDEWLGQELGDDHLIDDDDDDRAFVDSVQWILDDHRVPPPPVIDDRALVDSVPDCSGMQEVDEWILDDRRPVIEEECSAAVPIDEWLQGDVEEEFSILAAAAAAPPIDLISSSSSSLEEEGQKGDFDFGDYRDDHFAAWDVLGDSRFPWAGTQQQMLLPVV